MRVSWWSPGVDMIKQQWGWKMKMDGLLLPCLLLRLACCRIFPCSVLQCSQLPSVSWREKSGPLHPCRANAEPSSHEPHVTSAHPDATRSDWLPHCLLTTHRINMGSANPRLRPHRLPVHALSITPRYTASISIATLPIACYHNAPHPSRLARRRPRC